MHTDLLAHLAYTMCMHQTDQRTLHTHDTCVCKNFRALYIHKINICTHTLQPTIAYTKCPHKINSAYFYIHTMHVYAQTLQGILHTHIVCTLTFQRTLHTHRVCTQTLQCTLHTQCMHTNRPEHFTYTQCICMHINTSA